MAPGSIAGAPIEGGPTIRSPAINLYRDQRSMLSQHSYPSSRIVSCQASRTSGFLKRAGLSRKAATRVLLGYSPLACNNRVACRTWSRIRLIFSTRRFFRYARYLVEIAEQSVGKRFRRESSEAPRRLATSCIDTGSSLLSRALSRVPWQWTQSVAARRLAVTALHKSGK